MSDRCREWFFHVRGRLVQVWLLPGTWCFYRYRRGDVTAVAIGPVQVRWYSEPGPEAPAS